MLAPAPPDLDVLNDTSFTKSSLFIVLKHTYCSQKLLQNNYKTILIFTPRKSREHAHGDLGHEEYAMVIHALITIYNKQRRKGKVHKICVYNTDRLLNMSKQIKQQTISE